MMRFLSLFVFVILFPLVSAYSSPCSHVVTVLDRSKVLVSGSCQSPGRCYLKAGIPVRAKAPETETCPIESACCLVRSNSGKFVYSPVNPVDFNLDYAGYTKGAPAGYAEQSIQFTIDAMAGANAEQHKYEEGILRAVISPLTSKFLNRGNNFDSAENEENNDSGANFDSAGENSCSESFNIWGPASSVRVDGTCLPTIICSSNDGIFVNNKHCSSTGYGCCFNSPFSYTPERLDVFNLAKDQYENSHPRVSTADLIQSKLLNGLLSKRSWASRFFSKITGSDTVKKLKPANIGQLDEAEEETKHDKTHSQSSPTRVHVEVQID